MSYLLLFLAAFGAASVLPFYSEPFLVALTVAGEEPLWALWLTATVGNVLGAVLNWWLAKNISRFQHHRWYPFTPSKWQRAQVWFNRYGVWTLLLSWAPIGGDALTVVAGLMRVPLKVFVPLVSIGKALRFAAVIWLTLQAL